MITGTLYIAKSEGQWETTPAAFVRLDPENSGRVWVLGFPTPSIDPLGPTVPLLVSALLSPAAPESGEYVYVAD
jgi:hypothetical protein